MKNTTYILKITLLCIMLFACYFTANELLGGMQTTMTSNNYFYDYQRPEGNQPSAFQGFGATSGAHKSRKTHSNSVERKTTNTVKYNQLKIRKRTIDNSNIAQGAFSIESNTFSRERKYAHTEKTSSIPNLAFNTDTRPIYANIFKSAKKSVLATNTLSTDGIFSDASIENSNPVIQRTNVDPEGDPTGDPIPVGDGLFILITFLGVYAASKKLKTVGMLRF